MGTSQQTSPGEGVPIGNWVGAGGRDRGRGRNWWKGRWTQREAAVRVYSTLAP